MNVLKYLIVATLSLGMFTSCVDDKEFKDEIPDINIIEFDNYAVSYSGTASDTVYEREYYIKLSGPSKKEVTGDIVISVSAAASSTAIEGVHFNINNPTITLQESNDYYGIVYISMLATEENAAPSAEDPGYEDYVLPVIDLQITKTSGDESVVATGKIGEVSLFFTPPNPYAGNYTTELAYWHPTAGGAYPPTLTSDPSTAYGGLRTDEKEMIAVSGTSVDVYFGLWGESDDAWATFTINADGSISDYSVRNWSYSVELGDPYNPSLVSHYDPDTGVIYLYYTYVGAGGNRIFWETFTPEF